jgi:DNA-binding NtrC family response regulator
LFGYERGSFTGATERRIGRIEAANGGTLFLDEIGDMPMNVQPQLLRFLQEMKIQRIGGKDEVAVNLRVVAATNVELEQAVQKQMFRKDLFFRLNILRLDLPPLRERHGDVPLFVRFLLQQVSAEHELPVPEITAPALKLLEAYSWPGNVRELISAIRRAVIMCDEDRLDVEDFAFLDETDVITPSNQPVASEATRSRRRKPTGQELQEILALHDNNVSQTARYYGVSRVTVYTWLKALK